MRARLPRNLLVNSHLGHPRTSLGGHFCRPRAFPSALYRARRTCGRPRAAVLRRGVGNDDDGGGAAAAATATVDGGSIYSGGGI